jgi:hypothetical protein
MRDGERDACHRYAPRPYPNRDPWVQWPWIKASNWCGEWAPLPPTEDDLFSDYHLSAHGTPVPFETASVPPGANGWAQEDTHQAPMTYDDPLR